MGRISITNRDLHYGISVDALLWVKQGILTRDQVRESRDEEVVLDLLADLLLDSMAPTARNTAMPTTAWSDRLLPQPEEGPKASARSSPYAWILH